MVLFVKKKDYYQYDPINDYADIRDNFKTGDIVVFSCKKHDDLYCKIEYYLRTNFVGTEFGHSGIILRIKNKIYLVECTNKMHVGDEYAHRLNNLGKGGIRIINFDKLIRHYQKEYSATFAVKFISQEIPNKTILKAIADYKNVTFPKKSLVVFMAMIDMCISHQLARELFRNHDSNKMICCEFVHHILHKCGVLAPYPSYLFWPPQIMEGTLDKLALIKYSRPYKFEIKGDLDK